MKKTIFTYSRKRPTTTLTIAEDSSEHDSFGRKHPKLDIEEWENLRTFQTNVTVRRPLHKAPSTPQTRKHYENIRETLATADRKLGFLSALTAAGSNNSSTSASTSTSTSTASIYKKLFRLDPSTVVGIPDLLAVLRQTEGVLSFEDWLKGKSSLRVEKIGEATFSEVFCFGGEEVVKIIPLQLDKPINEDVFPLPITFSAAIHECKVLRRVAMLKEHRTAARPLLWTGFNQLLDMRVVRGAFPTELIEAWKSFTIVKRTENTIPDHYDDNDHFLILSLQHGGMDLESFKFERIEQIRSVICQIACALALAEEKAEFEHRDLHLGNVLIKRIEDEELCFEVDDAIAFPAEGVICSIIDYSLSRVSLPDQVLFRDLDCLPWLFEGDGAVDSQFSVYQEMKASKGPERSWKDFCPKSNVLWMSFLMERLVLKQRNAKVKKPKKAFDELSALARRVISYPSISEMIRSDSFFQKHLCNK